MSITGFEKEEKLREIIMSSLIKATTLMEGRESWDTPIVQLQIIADKLIEKIELI